MFPQNNPQGGNGPTTSAMLQQNIGLLGKPQIQESALFQGVPSLQNNTAPSSSTTNPAAVSMVKALKGF